MPAVTVNKFNDLIDQMGRGTHNFAAHTLKLALTNVAPAATATSIANITQIAATGGYQAGGYSLSGVSWAETDGTARLIVGDALISATGGNVGPFRYLVIYNATATTPAGPLICWMDYGASFTLTDGESLTVDFDNVAGIVAYA